MSEFSFQDLIKVARSDRAEDRNLLAEALIGMGAERGRIYRITAGDPTERTDRRSAGLSTPSRGSGPVVRSPDLARRHGSDRG